MVLYSFLRFRELPLVRALLAGITGGVILAAAAGDVCSNLLKILNMNPQVVASPIVLVFADMAALVLTPFSKIFLWLVRGERLTKASFIE